MDPFKSAKNQALIYMIATEGKLARINAAFFKNKQYCSTSSYKDSPNQRK